MDNREPSDAEAAARCRALLCELLKTTGDSTVPLKTGALLVFGTDPRYWRCADWAVSSAVSGPGIVMVPRRAIEREWWAT